MAVDIEAVLKLVKEGKVKLSFIFFITEQLTPVEKNEGYVGDSFFTVPSLLLGLSNPLLYHN